MNTKSSKPKKQRKMYAEMPLHKRQKTMAVHLGKELRKRIGKRALVIKKGDKVKIMRGNSRGKTGKVAAVYYGRRIVHVEGIVRKRSDGREVPVQLHASNLLLLEMEGKDDRRAKAREAK